MKKRTITDGVSWLGAIDWDRRLFQLEDVRKVDFKTLDGLAEAIAEKHRALPGRL